MIVQAMREAARNTFVYNARSERLEQWSFVLLTLACMGIFQCFGNMGWNAIFPINWMFVVMFMWLLLANVSLMVRRLHDHDVSGFWLLLPLFPITLMLLAARDIFGSGVAFLTKEQAAVLFTIGQFSLMTSLTVFGSFFVRPGNKKSNRFGPAP